MMSLKGYRAFQKCNENQLKNVKKKHLNGFKILHFHLKKLLGLVILFRVKMYCSICVKV